MQMNEKAKKMAHFFFDLAIVSIYFSFLMLILIGLIKLMLLVVSI